MPLERAQKLLEREQGLCSRKQASSRLDGRKSALSAVFATWSDARRETGPAPGPGGRMKLDLLAIAPHPDDVELTCGGTMLKMAQEGYATGIVDLTRGETGTRGTPETRLKESARAAKFLGAKVRRNLGLARRAPARLRRVQDRDRRGDPRIRAAHRDPALLGGTPPRPLHRGHAWLGGVLRRRA